jgi:3-dehydroquinate synthase
MNPLLMQLPSSQAITYPIYIAPDLLAQPELWLPADCRQRRIVIITDENVKKEYGEALVKVLEKHTPLLLSFPAGEQNKTAETKQALEAQMLAAHCDRNTLILALGGGVVGDLAGFVAATYMRGVPYIQVPTTLLAMVDSSVGGKTAVDCAYGKNLIGAFWHPVAVVADLNCLKTLPKTQLINGLVEALKVFMTSDAESLEYASSHIAPILTGDISVLEPVIRAAVKIKMDVVSRDEKESHLRMILNFGHTIGHALEKITDYGLLHGYAVALGILVEAKIAELRGLLSAEAYQKIKVLFLNLTISGKSLQSMDLRAIVQATRSDKKSAEGKVRYVLLQALGEVFSHKHVFAHPISDEDVTKALVIVRDEFYVRQ